MLPACLPDMTNYDFDAWLISVRHFLCTRAKMQMVASDRARRENVPGHIPFCKRYNCTLLVYIFIYDRMVIDKKRAFMSGVSYGAVKRFELRNEKCQGREK